LRPGNVHSADGWESVLKPVVTRYQGKVSRIYFRADAGFANPEVYEYLEGIKYAIRLPANHLLQERIGYLLKRRASSYMAKAFLERNGWLVTQRGRAQTRSRTFAARRQL
jgi:Transposase DDE domain group 1